MIIINEKNRETIGTMIETCQTHAKVGLITYDDIVSSINFIAEKYGIYKKDFEGSSFTIDLFAEDFPRSYKGNPESTQFKIIFDRGNWKLLWVRRYITQSKKYKFCADLSRITKLAIINKYQYFY